MAVTVVVVTGDSGNDNQKSAAINSPGSTLRERAQDRAAQSDLRNALVTTKVQYVDTQSYKTMTLDQLQAAEPSLNFVPGSTASNRPTVISVDPVSSTEIVMTTRSLSGICFAIRDRADTNEGTKFAIVRSKKCTGDNAAQITEWTSDQRTLTSG